VTELLSLKLVGYRRDCAWCMASRSSPKRELLETATLKYETTAKPFDIQFRERNQSHLTTKGSWKSQISVLDL